MDIELTFINQSDDVDNSSVVFFQKNVTEIRDELAVAWTVIKNCGKGWSHKFMYPADLYVGAEDSWGNVSDLYLAANGQKWDVVKGASGDQMALDNDPSSSSTAVEIKNCLPAGDIGARVYKDGKLLAVKTGLSPQQSALFEFKPILWAGVGPQIQEGELIGSAMLVYMSAEISLLGITKANLVLTGGGTGPDAKPYEFTLQPTA